MKAYLVNYCDAHKMYSSYRLCGVFTSRKKLNVALNKALKRKDIESEHRTVNHLSDYELQTQLDYLAVEIIDLNIDQQAPIFKPLKNYL
jgi:hypothetical protein